MFHAHHNNLWPLLLHEYYDYCYIHQSSNTVQCILFFSPENYPHKSGAIFHIDLYVFNIHTEIPNGNNKLNHVKQLAVFQNKPFWIPYGRMNHLCCDWNKHMLTIVWNTLCNRYAWWLSLLNERFVLDKLVAISIFFWTWCDKQCCQAQLHPSSRGRWFFVWGSFIRQAHCYPNQWNNALMEAAIVSKMRTPAITLWFPEQCLLGFFILEKQLASQKEFLIRSKLSITVYLFLVLYRSTSLQSLLFLKNIETFLCK
jgi:hypothetical protein